MIDTNGHQLFRVHAQLTSSPRDKSGSHGITADPQFLGYGELRKMINTLREMYACEPVTAEFTGPGVNLVEKLSWRMDTGQRVITDTVWIQH